MSNLNRSSFQGHPFHLVSPSPWPIFTCISLLNLTISGILNMHDFKYAGYWLPLVLILLISSVFFWFRDVISEGTYIGNHTLAVQKGLNMGVALFIVSEALLFLAIFWTYFHSSLSPAVELGGGSPPVGIEAINAFELPLFNTVLLLAFGVTITYCNHSLIQGNRNGIGIGILLFTSKEISYFLKLVYSVFNHLIFSKDISSSAKLLGISKRFFIFLRLLLKFIWILLLLLFMLTLMLIFSDPVYCMDDATEAKLILQGKINKALSGAQFWNDQCYEIGYRIAECNSQQELLMLQQELADSKKNMSIDMKIANTLRARLESGAYDLTSSSVLGPREAPSDFSSASNSSKKNA